MKLKTIILIAIFVLAAVFCSYLFGWPIERVRLIGRDMYIVDEYQDYYFSAKIKKSRDWIMGNTHFVCDVYFLPGQRKKMTGKIKTNIISELEIVIKEHGNIFYKYEISDDFKQILIYEISSDIDKLVRYHLKNEVGSRIGTLFELYLNINEGHVVSSDGLGARFIYPDG